MQKALAWIVPLSCKAAYLNRYAEPDKGWTDRARKARWPMPFWHMDAAMASLLILHTATDEGLGACFFGIPPERAANLKAEFGIPDDHDPIGAITIGDPSHGRSTGLDQDCKRRQPRRPPQPLVATAPTDD